MGAAASLVAGLLARAGGQTGLHTMPYRRGVADGIVDPAGGVKAVDVARVGVGGAGGGAGPHQQADEKIVSRVLVADGHGAVAFIGQADEGLAVEDRTGLGGGAGVEVHAGFEHIQRLGAAAQVFASLDADPAGQLVAAAQIRIRPAAPVALIEHRRVQHAVQHRVGWDCVKVHGR
jgi:hypothetical protein